MRCYKCNAPLFKHWLDDYFIEKCINLNCMANKKKTYKIEIVTMERATIKCLECGKTSHNQNDVKYLYCGNCHKYHE